MRLNLKKLRDSKNEKESRIYYKAMEMVDSGHETKVLKADEINELKEKYPTLKISEKAGNSFHIQSKFDDWLISDEQEFLVLYHRGKVTVGGKSGRDRNHVQDVFRDLDFALKSIVAHDNFKINVKLGGESKR